MQLVLLVCITLISFFAHAIAALVETLSAVVLILLFLLQKFGTSRVSFLFSPIMGAWTLCTPIVGIYSIIHHYPSIFKALSPHYIFRFFWRNGKSGWLLLGGTVLCITGMYLIHPFCKIYHFWHRTEKIIFEGPLSFTVKSFYKIHVLCSSTCSRSGYKLNNVAIWELSKRESCKLMLREPLKHVQTLKGGRLSGRASQFVCCSDFLYEYSDHLHNFKFWSLLSGMRRCTLLSKWTCMQYIVHIFSVWSFLIYSTWQVLRQCLLISVISIHGPFRLFL